MEQADLERQVQTVITSLPDKCRTVFEQYLYSELTPQEIAEKKWNLCQHRACAY